MGHPAHSRQDGRRHRARPGLRPCRGRLRDDSGCVPRCPREAGLRGGVGDGTERLLRALDPAVGWLGRKVRHARSQVPCHLPGLLRRLEPLRQPASGEIEAQHLAGQAAGSRGRLHPQAADDVRVAQRSCTAHGGYRKAVTRGQRTEPR